MKRLLILFANSLALAPGVISLVGGFFILVAQRPVQAQLAETEIQLYFSANAELGIPPIREGYVGILSTEAALGLSPQGCINWAKRNGLFDVSIPKSENDIHDLGGGVGYGQGSCTAWVKEGHPLLRLFPKLDETW